MSDSMRDWLHKHVGRTSGLGLSAMIVACRRDRALRAPGDIRGKRARKNDHGESWAKLARRTTEYILRDMGFADSDIGKHVQHVATTFLRVLNSALLGHRC